MSTPDRKRTDGARAGGATGARAPFMSVANYEHLMRVLQKYMEDKRVSPEEEGVRLNRLVYKTMMDVDAENPAAPSIEKNRLTVEVVAAFVANVANGRGGAGTRYPPPATAECGGTRGKPVTDSPIGDMDRRLAELAAARSDVDIGDPYRDFQRALRTSVELTGSTHAALRPDLAALRNNIGTPCDPPDAVGGLYGDAALGLGGGAAGEDAIGTRASAGPKRIVRKYLMINGYDRNWTTFPLRFAFTVNLAANDSGFRDIRSIAATRLIIPREIVEEKTLTNVPKTRFEEPFNLQYPYLILKVAEFQSVYKASNAASQNAFCHFVYDNHYTSPNGRGYIHLVPAQKETLEFHINPLSALQQLELSVQRPSGALLNNSRDQSKVIRMDWNNQVNMNRQLIMVTLKTYFDRNEFFEGDTVRFTQFAAPASPAGPALAAFVNRQEGHEISEFGTPNADGYVNSFYIRVPGAFNPDTGLFNIDTAATTDLMNYVSSIDYDASPPDSIALVINASLQVAATFEIRVEEEDVTVGGP
eukprot:jgi/Tetstr1/453930/TSEL_040849.t1